MTSTLIINTKLFEEIFDNINKPKYKLLDWINIKKLDWHQLSSNPNAIELLSQNQDKINWTQLSSNPNAIELLYQNEDKINLKLLSNNKNPEVINILKKIYQKLIGLHYAK